MSGRAPKQREARGFTLVEMAVALTIVALIGAVTYATLAGYRDRDRALRSVVILRELTGALNRYDTLMGGGTVLDGRYPGRLSHLTTQVLPTDLNSCGVSYGTSPAITANWAAAGPFYGRSVTVGVGFRIPIGRVYDTLIRVPATAADAARTFARQHIRIDSVFYDDAVELNRLLDGDSPTPRTASPVTAIDTTGTVVWDVAEDFDGRLSSIFWRFPVGGC